MATKRRKKSTSRRKSTVKRKTTVKTKNRSTRRKKDFLDKCLDIFN